MIHDDIRFIRSSSEVHPKFRSSSKDGLHRHGKFESLPRFQHDLGTSPAPSSGPGTVWWNHLKPEIRFLTERTGIVPPTGYKKASFRNYTFFVRTGCGEFVPALFWLFPVPFVWRDLLSSQERLSRRAKCCFKGLAPPDMFSTCQVTVKCLLLGVFALPFQSLRISLCDIRNS